MEARVPQNKFVVATPVVRQFGREGTKFNPPIEITIGYTDGEIAGLDEGSLRPYLFNSATGIFDIQVPHSDIVSRDIANNTITFRVDHFSIYGLGGSFERSLPGVAAHTGHNDNYG